ncbi:hypothetical protein [Glycomyces paridis]|uniref:Uncharacterized protein n=1 Tax=Glycomyces paridis TaxID=2126555 RepID=A0A4S8PQW4_9ACTN|nr:hypothetical protein [Glycomyces paridis]THV30674.1 hypothetical protein E9998_04610 [Glycomyces paridis]
MADATTLADPEPQRNRRSDGASGLVGYLGDFTRGPAVFTVYDLGPETGVYPAGPNRYLIDCEDGARPYEICRFTGDLEDPPVWRGAWNDDPWCPWILAKARKLAAGSKSGSRSGST